MVFVPAGKFNMGSNILPDEQPIHTVNLKAFWIDKYEIPNGAYQKCVTAGGCPQPVSWNHIDDTAKLNYPMTLITWAEAAQYCRWAGERLPTEAEWEKAARGTDGRVYPWGDQFKQSLARTAYDFDLSTVPVDRYQGGASPYGALNMAGNVWEWTADWYADNYYRLSPQDNPPGPASGDKRVSRGGGYGGTEAVMRTSKRRDIYPDERGSYLGFRCAN